MGMYLNLVKKKLKDHNMSPIGLENARILIDCMPNNLPGHCPSVGLLVYMH